MPIVIKNINDNCYLCSLLTIFNSLNIIKYISYYNDILSYYIINYDIEGIKKELNINGTQDVNQVYMNIMEKYRGSDLWKMINVKCIETSQNVYEKSCVSVNSQLQIEENVIQTSYILVLHLKIPIRLKSHKELLKIYGYKVIGFIHYKKNHYYASIIENKYCYLIDKDIRMITEEDMLNNLTYMIFLKKKKLKLC